jgi:hypothetical protein
VDTEGWLLTLAVTAASASDIAAARLVTARLTALLATLRITPGPGVYSRASMAAASRSRST